MQHVRTDLVDLSVAGRHTFNSVRLSVRLNLEVAGASVRLWGT